MEQLSNKDAIALLKAEMKLQPELEDVYENYFLDGQRNKTIMAEKIIDNLEPEELLEEFPDIDCVKVCDSCGKFMIEGYNIENDSEHYCCDECLHKAMSEEEYNRLYEDGDSFYTNWYENARSLKK